MHEIFLKFFASAAVLFVLSLSTSIAAQGGNHNPDQHSHYKDKKGKSKNDQHYRGDSKYKSHKFGYRQRAIAREYYGPRLQSGRCPPGLAKKYNGCMPPGQAKKWRMGYPLARGVVFYDLPSYLAGRLGSAGPSYRYVRVAADILLIAVGTGMVIDAIEDLNSM